MAESPLAAHTAEAFKAMESGDKSRANELFAARDVIARSLAGESPPASSPSAAAGDGTPDAPLDGDQYSAPDAKLTAIPSDEPGPFEQPHQQIADVLSQSVSGLSLLGPNERANIDRALENGREFAKRDPDNFAKWESWAQESADNFGLAIKRLADGDFPTGTPADNAGELAEAGQRHQALRQIRELNKEFPPGSPQYTTPEVQRRLQALYRIAHGAGAIVGRNLRTM